MIDLEALFTPQPGNLAFGSLGPSAPPSSCPASGLLGEEASLSPLRGASKGSPAGSASPASQSALEAQAEAPDAKAALLPSEADQVGQAAPLPPPRVELDRFPEETRPILQEFASLMGEDLLAVSPVRCSWEDCRFPMAVLIRAKDNDGKAFLVWGCPKCGREYRPQVVSADVLERALSGLDSQGKPAGANAQAGSPSLASKAICPCGSIRWKDTPIHNGRSIRRNCQQCGRWLGFPVWYGQRQEERRPQERLQAGPTIDQAAALLAKAHASGWPRLHLNRWTTLGPGAAAWAAFGRFLAGKGPAPGDGRTRLEIYRQALEALEKLQGQPARPGPPNALIALGGETAENSSPTEAHSLVEAQASPLQERGGPSLTPL